MSESAIQTYSGRRFSPLEPDVTQIDIGDIAHALANLCRFGGHSRAFYCPTPDQRVLTADLEWVPAGDLEPDDELVGFDEHPWQPGATGKRRRRFRYARVVHAATVRRPIVRLELEDGSTVCSSVEHPWLVATKQSRNQRWLTAGQIADDLDRERARYMHKFVEPWTTASSWEAGWLAGIYDGEGYLSVANRGGCQLGVAQRPGAVLDRIRAAHLRLGFGNVRYQRVGTRDVVSLNIAGGWREIMRLLGSVRPVRLLAKFTTGLRNGSFDKQLDGCRAPLRIVRAYRERSSWVAALETTTHTFLCEGLGAHNSIAQHCCIVADAAEATGADAVTVLSALLHDASEAYLGDLPHPLKHRSPLGRLYREIEEPLQAAILARFQLPAETPPLVKRIDRAALAAERAALMRPADDEWWPELDGVDALELAIEPWPAERGAREFLDRFERLEARR